MVPEKGGGENPSDNTKEVVNKGNTLLTDISEKMIELEEKKNKLPEEPGLSDTSEIKKFIGEVVSAASNFLPKIEEILNSIDSNITNYGASKEIINLKDKLRNTVNNLKTAALKLKEKTDKHNFILSKHVKPVNNLVAKLEALSRRFA